MAGRQVFYPDGQRHEGKEYGGGRKVPLFFRKAKVL